MINKKGQLLLMAGIMLCVTVMIVSISISHSVTLGQKQGENHDLTPMISMVVSHFPTHLDWAIDQANLSSNDTQDIHVDQINSIFVDSGNEFEFIFRPGKAPWPDEETRDKLGSFAGIIAGGERFTPYTVELARLGDRCL